MDNDRTEELFGYFHRMEIYVPPAKRTLGYWAMPVLHVDRIVGSVDPRFDRASGELVVNRGRARATLDRRPRAQRSCAHRCC